MLKVEPDDSFLNYLYAVSHYKIKDYSKALRYYGVALSCGFDRFSVLYDRGLLFLEIGEVEAAKDDLENALSTRPNESVLEDLKRKKIRNILNEIEIEQNASNKVSLTSPAVISCIPKTGTMLLKNILLSVLGDSNFIPRGKNNLASSQLFDELKTFRNCIYFGHFWYTEGLARKLSSIPKVILIRDPRDTVVSLAHFLESVTRTNWTEKERKQYWEGKTWNEKLSAAILGMTYVSNYPESVLDTYMNHGLKWTNEPNSLLVRYEDLLGSNLGGDNSKVKDKIKEILSFIGISGVDESELGTKIIRGADPAGSSTFRSARSGSWRKEFGIYNIKLIKVAAPGLVSGLGYEQNESWDVEQKDATLLPINRKELNMIRQPVLEREDYENLRMKLDGSAENLLLFDGWALTNFMRCGKNENVIFILKTRLLPRSPRNSRWNYLYAFYLHTEKRDLDNALIHYNIALEGSKESDEFYTRYHRGILHKQLGNIVLARKDLERAILLEPESSYVRELLKTLN